MKVDRISEFRMRPEAAVLSARSPQLFDKPSFRSLFADEIRAASTHVKPREVVPVRVRGSEFHMWMLPFGELRQIPDQQHERIAREIFERIGLQGSRFRDSDGTRFRERAVVDGGIVKVCSHNRQLQMSLPIDITDAQLRVLYGLSRVHANERIRWDIHDLTGQLIAKSPDEIEGLSTVSWTMLMHELRDANRAN